MTGAFAHKLPAQQPTLRQMAQEVIVSRSIADKAETIHGYSVWSELDGQALAARDEFLAALERETGLTRELLAEIGAIL